MKPIIIIDNVFTSREFEMIDIKDLSLNKSLFNGEENTIRNSTQCNVFNSSISNLLLSKIQDALPDVIYINPCLRYIVYEEHGYFELHYDEEIIINNMVSKYTVLFCLNTCEGETIITDDDFNKHGIDNIKNRLIIFHQDLEHRGYNNSPKNIIRTDAF
jgi:hypothetical protein